MITRASEPSRFQRSLYFLQAAVSPRRRSGAWREEIRSVIAGLQELNGATESHFTAVGGKLMEFLSASRNLHAGIAGLSTLVSGEHAQEACAALVSVRRYLQEMQQRTQEGGCALRDLQASAARIHRGFSALTKISLSFHIAAVLARIETAHLAGRQQDLGNLADGVNACSGGIQARAEQVLETSASFHSRAAATLAEVSRLEVAQKQKLPALLAKVEEDLRSFEGRQREAASSAARLTEDLNAISRDLGSIATSIQFHDITRQQIEHVIEALQSLLQETQSRPLSLSGAALARVQTAQLKAAAASFLQSSRNIDLELEKIAARVEQMGQASQSILGLDESQADSFLGGMRSRFEIIVRAVSDSHNSERGAQAILDGLASLSRQLRDSIAEVQTIEIQLSRIAINAAISSSHIGAMGEPLNVVAGIMQTLQLECETRSSEAEVDLNSIRRSIDALALANSAASADGSGAALLDDLTLRMESLQTASSSSVQAAAAVSEQAGALRGNLDAARDRAGIGVLFEETVNRCCGALDGVALQARPLWPFGSPAAAEDHAATRYTMQKERDIHLSVTTGAAPESPTLTCEAPAAAADDDVEFF